MGSLGLGNGSLRMDDVYLEGSTPEGPAVVAHLSVIVDTEGITFLGPEPGERRTVGWDRTSPLEFGPPAALPDGEQGTSLDFAVDGRPLRLLVHSKRGSKSPDEEVPTVGPASNPAVPPPVDLVEPVFIDPPAPLPVVEAPSALIEPPAAVLAEPPAPALTEPPAPPLAEPPAPLLADPPAPLLLEPPAPVPSTPPAPVLLEPPSPVLAAPPAAPPAELVELTEPPESAAPPELTEPQEFAERPESTELTESAELPEPVVLVGGADDTFVAGAAEGWTHDDDAASVRLPAWFRYVPRPPRQSKKHASPRTHRIVKIVAFTVLAGLIPIAVGFRYFQTHTTTGRITGVALSDTVIAGRVGIQPGDLTGWSADATRMGNAFAAGATTHGTAALRTAEQASTVLARCLHVPVSAVEGAFGMGSSVSQRTAEVVSPSYADPAGNGGAVNSVVDMVQSPQVGAADARVFQNPALFATCYQPFVQAMLPYAAVGGGSGFATATVQPVVVPVPNGPGTVTVAGFQIARIANDPGQTKTVVTTATAVFVGRVQATLGTVSDLVFSLNAQNTLVRDLEIRSLGVGEL